MDKESTQLILDNIDKIAAKLGTTVEHVWPWFVRQQYIDAFYYLFISVVVWGALFVGLRFCLKHWNSKSGYSIYGNDHEDLWWAVIIITAVIAAILLIIGIFEFADILNPEFHALKDIIKSVR
ncbi:MAG: hypothetical protein KJ556_21130 [Gammaproteobacteria bacterium]|nr:hypothetical protein [Gammaproteobacteria bacterium]